MLPRLCASPVVSLRTFEWQTDPCAPRESVRLSQPKRGFAEMKTIATPTAIAADVEEASKDAVAPVFHLNQKCLEPLHQRRAVGSLRRVLATIY